MGNRLRELGATVKVLREHRGLSQEQVANGCGFEMTRTVVSYLEQGRSLPKPDSLSAICKYVDIPNSIWEPFTKEKSQLRFEFEEHLSNFVGRLVNLDMLDETAQDTAEDLISNIFSSNPTGKQLLDLFNSILVYYGVGPAKRRFFEKYFNPSAFGSIKEFSDAIKIYQMDAIRLFPTFSEAFEILNGSDNVDSVLLPIRERSLEEYQARTDWNQIEIIGDELLPDLGYISAQRWRKEANERKWLISQLKYVAGIMKKDGPSAIQELAVKNKRKIDSLLRKFESTVIHGVSSPLFQPDPDALEREAERLAPKSDEELQRMERTQRIALRNLSRYLAADHLDVYVATSMRTDSDYVSVNHFVTSLFAHERIRPLKLRYFNPTQSWIEDRVAKGLVEALMLKRASVTIYMAQKTDTFGKDSEASVALGQGKPVIVYVPKLDVGEAIDSEELFGLPRRDLVQRYNRIPGEDEADDTMDDEALVAGILKNFLERRDDEVLRECVRKYWADFELYAEAERFSAELRQNYRSWLDDVLSNNKNSSIDQDLRSAVVSALVASSINFEKRAKIFREVHPLALQVILSTGVLNGILVVRTVEQCAKVLYALVSNCLELDSQIDDENYRIVERLTKSTIRVISRNELLQYAFEAHYKASRLS